MSNVLGFDISSWQRRPGRPWFRELRQAGFGVAIIQLWGGTPNDKGPNTDAAYQLTMSIEEGFDVFGYLWVPSGPTETDQLVLSAVNAAADAFPRVRYLFPDVEREYVGAVRMQNCLDNCKATGKPTGIYCSQNSFSLIGGSFPGEKLWDASWFYNGGIMPDRAEWPADPGFATYGSWTTRAIRQFAGDVNLFGGMLDLDVVNYDRLELSATVTTIPNPTTEELTMGQYEDLVNRIDGLTNTLNAHVSSPHNQQTPPVPTPEPAPQKTYTTKSGDSLGAIAQAYTGNASRWPEIPNLRPEVRADPRRLQVGEVLIIPW